MVEDEKIKERREREEELEDEIQTFEKEREKIRKIVGRIGGLPTEHARMVNIIFIIAVLTAFAMSIVRGGKVRFFMLEVGILLLSLKLVYFLESHMRLNHFQFWILSSLEWRLDKIEKKVNAIRQEPLNIRIRYVWGSVAITMFFVLFIWVLSMKMNFLNINSDTQTQESMDELQEKIDTIRGEVTEESVSIDDLLEQSAPDSEL